ncbi:MAG: class I SAM-dependent methyltransferase [Alphaproteobacteria bacterium]
MAARGAIVSGIDVNPEVIARADEADQVAGASFQLGSADAMPFEDGSKDMVVFMHSLHHMDPEQQRKAIAEAQRVLAPGGELFFSEPLPEGSRYELNKLVVDERDLRARAQEAIAAAIGNGFVGEKSARFTIDRCFADFEAFRAQAAKGEERTAKFEAHEAELREIFERLGTKREDGWYFDQPMQINLLRKTG